jgi:hypothetical protein
VLRVRAAGFYGHLPRTLIDLNSSMSALGYRQLRITSGYAVRTKPQALRPLLHGAPSSFKARIRC